MSTDPAGTPGTRRFLLDLPLRPPYDWPAMLGFLALRAIPGVEAVQGEAYARSIRVDDVRGWMLVRAAPREAALRAELHLVQGSPGPRLLARLRHLFDLDTDPGPMLAHLGRDPLLEPLVAARPGLRVPGAWEGFELGVRAVLGQQVTLGAARTLGARLVALHGETLPSPPDAAFAGIERLFPRAARVAEAQELGLALRMPRARAAALCGLARAAAQAPDLLGDTLAGAVPGAGGRAGSGAGAGTGAHRSARPGAQDAARPQALEASLERLRALPGIGDWTAQYIAMRALRQPDAFPAGDVGLARAAAVDGRRPGAAELLARAEAWRPWRAYAALQLWAADAGAAPPK